MPSSDAPSKRLIRSDLALLCAIALLPRLVLSWVLPDIAHPDEVFQYVEQAHRVVFGSGLVPWEWQVGARSWMLPGLLLPILSLAHALNWSPATQHFAIAAMMSVLWLPVVASAYLWGWRMDGRAAAWSAGVLNAVWFETLHLSAHPLADTFGALFLVPALYLAERSRRTLFAAGLLLGLALVTRVQLLPVVAFAALWACRKDRRAWAMMAAGGAMPVLLIGAIDWLCWGVPYGSFLQYWHYNVTLHAADVFGVKPWFTYPLMQLMLTCGLILPAIWPMLRASRRAPLLLIAGVIYAAMLSGIGHKEERFLLPALPLGLTLVGTGAVLILRRRHTVLLCSAWVALSGSLGSLGLYDYIWRSGVAVLALTDRVNADLQVCGLGISPQEDWYKTGGYSALRPGITQYAGTASAAPAFNALLTVTDAKSPASPPPPGFTPVECRPDHDNAGNPITFCLLRRPGACDAGAAPKLTAETPEMAGLLRRP